MQLHADQQETCDCDLGNSFDSKLSLIKFQCKTVEKTSYFAHHLYVGEE
jgi:hypothetical protein